MLRHAPFVAQALERAVQDAVPGTAIRLTPGDHAVDSFLSELRGTATEPIWIGGIEGQPKPVLRGEGQAMQLSRVSHLIVHDLEITGSTNNGINCDEGALEGQ